MNPRLKKIQREIGYRLIKQDAEALQRQGNTLSEIAAELGYRRDLIAQILYYDQVQS